MNTDNTQPLEGDYYTNTLKKRVRKVVNAIKRDVRYVEDKVEEGFERAGELLEEGAEFVVEKEAEVIDLTVDAAKAVGREIKKDAEIVVEKTEEVLADAGELLEEGAEAVVEAGAEVVDLAEYAAEAVVDEAKVLGHNAIELTAKAIDNLDDAAYKVVVFAKHLPQKARKLAHEIEHKVHEMPDDIRLLQNQFSQAKLVDRDKANAAAKQFLAYFIGTDGYKWEGYTSATNAFMAYVDDEQTAEMLNMIFAPATVGDTHFLFKAKKQ